MSKLPCVSILLLLLVIISCDYSVESRRWLGVHRHPKSECKCRVMANKKVSCPTKTVFTMQEKQDILKCLCKKHHYELKDKFDLKFQTICKKIITGISIPLPLA
ncbi:hypothetical protein AGOR_G00073720 [Albula goreensis]|uniref:Uncharacterized protein n=1 Tax=Albula goreensis TaxID=1534307 RepID=A0A8T3DNE3_9TELE|nr:hypothetical protein AGOR_G00073720 [Albula goreensis]